MANTEEHDFPKLTNPLEIHDYYCEIAVVAEDLGLLPALPELPTKADCRALYQEIVARLEAMTPEEKDAYQSFWNGARILCGQVTRAASRHFARKPFSRPRPVVYSG